MVTVGMYVSDHIDSQMLLCSVRESNTAEQNVFKVHINLSQFLFLCKKNEKLANNFAYNFSFSPFVSEIFLFKYCQKVQFWTPQKISTNAPNVRGPENQASWNQTQIVDNQSWLIRFHRSPSPSPSPSPSLRLTWRLFNEIYVFLIAFWPKRSFVLCCVKSKCSWIPGPLNTRLFLQIRVSKVIYLQNECTKSKIVKELVSSFWFLYTKK